MGTVFEKPNIVERANSKSRMAILISGAGLALVFCLISTFMVLPLRGTEVVLQNLTITGILATCGFLIALRYDRFAIILLALPLLVVTFVGPGYFPLVVWVLPNALYVLGIVYLLRMNAVDTRFFIVCTRALSNLIWIALAIGSAFLFVGVWFSYNMSLVPQPFIIPPLWIQLVCIVLFVAGIAGTVVTTKTFNSPSRREFWWYLVSSACGVIGAGLLLRFSNPFAQVVFIWSALCIIRLLTLVKHLPLLPV